MSRQNNILEYLENIVDINQIRFAMQTSQKSLHLNKYTTVQGQ